MQEPKKVIVFEDEPELQKQYRSIFATLKQEYELKAIYNNCKDIVNIIRRDQPDAVLMDIQMPEVDGLQGLFLVKSNFPDIKVLMLTLFDADDKILDAIHLEADGYMLKKEFLSKTIMPHEVIRRSLRVVFEGGAYLTPVVAKKVLRLLTRNTTTRLGQILQIFHPKKEKEMAYDLSEQQLKVLELLVAGKTSLQIGEELGITENTVNTHIRRIYDKMQVHSRAAAIKKAIKEQIVKLD